MKENLAVIFGGVSVEHDVSIISALQAINYIDTNYYNIIPIYISKSGLWYTGKELLNLNNFKSLDFSKLEQVSFGLGDRILYKRCIGQYIKYKKIDVALVVMHGINGEDGKVASILDMCKVPYTSSDYVSSSVCIDKSIFKSIVKGLKVPSVKGFTVIDSEYYANTKNILNKGKKFGFPLIVKPATLGSSIGIKVCENIDEFKVALESGFEFCSKVLVEEFLTDIKEINVAITKDDNNLIVSELEQPIKNNKILSFENKYINDLNSMESVSRVIPAEIDEVIKNKIVDIARLIYTTLNLSGVVRFDFILKDDKVYINEVNTIPGSLAYYLFKPRGIPYGQLINILIKNAYKMYEKNSSKTYTFSSSILLSNNLGVKK